MLHKMFNRLIRDVRGYDFYRMVFTLTRLGVVPGKQLRLVPRRGWYFPGRDLDSLVKGVPGSEIEEYGGENREQSRFFTTLTINFMGFLGSSSVLPFYFNEIASDTTSVGYNLAGLLELLNDRLYQGLFKVWAAPRRIGRSKKEVEDDQEHILACCGLAKDLLSIPLSLIRVAYLVHPSRSSWGLQAFAQDVLQVPVRVVQHVPFKVKMHRTACSLVGRHASRLGVDMITGRWVTDISMYFRVEIGPLDYETFLTFLPASSSYKKMLYLLDLYRPLHLKYDILLRLCKEDVSGIQWRVGTPTSRLGFATVLASDAMSGELKVRWRPRDTQVRRISRIAHAGKDGKTIIRERMELDVLDD